ncbi:MAG: 23S rRNA (adenine(2503)-C(2))-methyltransferase RlmN, partial [bacterium]
LRKVHQKESYDGTVKFLFLGKDNAKVESVIIPEGDKWTACLSSQSGCALGCKFCATAMMGFVRNLTTGEIVAQLILMEKTLKRRMTHIVFMGMGEPLLNRQALESALRIFVHPLGLALSRRRITISTVGWLPGIKALNNGVNKDQGVSISYSTSPNSFSSSHQPPYPLVKLAVSLNATTDEKRKQLMPLASRYPIEEILKEAAQYQRLSGLKVTINYLLLGGVNDTPGDARQLAHWAKRFGFKVNVMEFNETGSEFRSSPAETRERFTEVLWRMGVRCTVRTSRGKDIQAACGQLAGKWQITDTCSIG